MQHQPLSFGVDQFTDQGGKYKSLRLGMVTNNAAITTRSQLSRLALLKAGFNITKLFSPEHGITAGGPDGEHQPDRKDVVTNLPVISLYGNQLAPKEEDLADIDVVLYDIPDAGCRFYTYLWTMTHVMEACAENGKELVILDRPNPISGNPDLTEGPMLDETNCSSFIGRWSIPLRHGCTLGELATYFAKTRVMNVELNVVRIKNWNRQGVIMNPEWPFTPPSPAIIDIETALLYPAMGLLEGTNIDEGRSSGSPFKICGAPWIDGHLLKEAFLSLAIPGIGCISNSYKPETGIYKNEQCQGLRFSITDGQAFRPVETGLQLIRLIGSLYPDELKERLYVTRANPDGTKHLDRLTGVPGSFEKICKGELSKNVPVAATWKESIRTCLLY